MSNSPEKRGAPVDGGDKPESPWRMPIVWLVIALPAVVVIASIGLIFIAGGDGNDVVRDDVQRTAQIQTADLSADAVAGEQKLSAIVRTDLEGGFIEVLPVSGNFDHTAPLRLTLAHPADSARDTVLLLAPGELGWRVDARLDDSHDWKVELGPEDAHWRLKGRLPKGQQATNLRPSLQAE
ncbi:FixH family protein [Lysobacter ciconiae]|uniref:FixH family protein n=1 Tax=Novilysobacter ciconiae TaxID=2781022 RepID=A0A7S6UFA7_9GAMM|nr:FixH family protein [Lysobacter ciconiae]QOW19213.1 FixH family protein [Lysobacter ciconiae]